MWLLLVHMEDAERQQHGQQHESERRVPAAVKMRVEVMTLIFSGQRKERNGLPVPDTL